MTKIDGVQDLPMVQRFVQHEEPQCNKQLCVLVEESSMVLSASRGHGSLYERTAFEAPLQKSHTCA